MTAKEARAITDDVLNGSDNESRFQSKLNILIKDTLRQIKMRALNGESSLELNFNLEEGAVHNALIVNLESRDYTINKTKPNKKAKVVVNW